MKIGMRTIKGITLVVFLSFLGALILSLLNFKGILIVSAFLVATIVSFEDLRRGWKTDSYTGSKRLDIGYMISAILFLINDIYLGNYVGAVIASLVILFIGMALFRKN